MDTLNTAVTSTFTCSLCETGTFSRLEVPRCTPSCPKHFEPDSLTNLCKCIQGDCFDSAKCHFSCGECNGISFENCRTCASGYYLQPSPRSCLKTCPKTYCPVEDIVYGGVCAPCEQFQPSVSLIVVNSSYVLMQFSTNMDITQSMKDLMKIEMTGYKNGFDIEIFQLSKKLYALNFTYSASFSPRPLIITFSSLSQIKDLNGYELNPIYKKLSIDLPSIYTLTQEEIDVSRSLTNWALYVIYFMIISFPILSLTGDLGIFWGLVDSAQIMNYLLYVNFSLPFNVKQFYEAMSIANLQFFPNIIWDILMSSGINIDLSDQAAPSNFAAHGVQYVSFLYNGGRILSIFLIFFILYGTVLLLGKINFESETLREFFQEAGGWMVFASIRLFLVGFLQVISFPSLRSVNDF